MQPPEQASASCLELGRHLMVQIRQTLTQQCFAAHERPHLVKAGVLLQAAGRPAVDQSLPQPASSWLQSCLHPRPTVSDHVE